RIRTRARCSVCRWRLLARLAVREVGSQVVVCLLEGEIRRNRERDIEHCARLAAEGWTVLRIWEHEVEADADACVDRIERAVRGEDRYRPAGVESFPRRALA